MCLGGNRFRQLFTTRDSSLSLIYVASLEARVKNVIPLTETSDQHGLSMCLIIYFSVAAVVLRGTL